MNELRSLVTSDIADAEACCVLLDSHDGIAALKALASREDEITTVDKGGGSGTDAVSYICSAELYEDLFAQVREAKMRRCEEEMRAVVLCCSLPPRVLSALSFFHPLAPSLSPTLFLIPSLTLSLLFPHRCEKRYAPGSSLVTSNKPLTSSLSEWRNVNRKPFEVV